MFSKHGDQIAFHLHNLFTLHILIYLIDMREQSLCSRHHKEAVKNYPMSLLNNYLFGSWLVFDHSA